uniref:Uncharacterized protein n=1 Tax=Anguilla anguilla TaxID=7936 RepID=A0A0E9QTE7_ANGAN
MARRDFTPFLFTKVLQFIDISQITCMNSPL